MPRTGRFGAGLYLALIIALSAPVAHASDDDPVRLRHRPVEPLAQAVELRLDPAADGFFGRTRVDLTAHAPTRTIRLHARDLELGTIQLTSRASGTVMPVHAQRGDLGLLTLSAENELEPGAYRLEIAFAGTFRKDGAGIYKTEFGGDTYLFTQFEARYGRLAFPCWDEPAFKHPWQITLAVPDHLAAFSNSEAVVETRADGWRTLQFARTPPMPTYLVALAVGPFDSVPVVGMSIPGRIITARGQAGLAGAIAAESPRILATLEEYFGIPYPFGKLDQVAVPEFTFGGMENAGLITYRDDAILRAPGDADESSRRGLVQIVAHEIAHHWFGNLVTMEWWNDLWLNESFASWMEGKVLNTAYPELRYAMHALAGRQRAMRIDALPSTRSVRRAITAEDDPEQFVDTLSYEKGEAVLTMIESWIGAETFREAMRLYFDRHRWGNTRAEHLWAAFSEASGGDVSAIVAGFIEQPGVPQVDIAVLAEDRVRLRQKRYAALGGELPAAAPIAAWQVPVTLKYATAEGVRTMRVLLRERDQTVTVPGISDARWVYPNADESGYYRWRLDEAGEGALLSGALAEIAPVERLGLLFNASALHDAGELAVERYLALLTRQAADPVPDVARRAIVELVKARDLYLNDGDAEDFARFCRSVLRPVLDRVGLQARPAEDAAVAALRRELITVLGVHGSDPEVIALARERSAEFLRDPRAIDPGVAEAFLEVAVWHGDRALFDACVEAFRRATVPTDRAMLLAALGGFRDPGIAERALELSLGPGLRSHERLVVAASLAEGTSTNRRRVVTWMMTHFDAIAAATSDFVVSELILLSEGPDSGLFAQAREFLLAPDRVTNPAAKIIGEATDRDRQRQALRARGEEAARRYFGTAQAVH